DGHDHDGDHGLEKRETRLRFTMIGKVRHWLPPHSLHDVPFQRYSRTRPVGPRTVIARALEGSPGKPRNSVPLRKVFPASMKAPFVVNFMIGGPPATPPKKTGAIFP